MLGRGSDWARRANGWPRQSPVIQPLLRLRDKSGKPFSVNQGPRFNEETLPQDPLMKEMHDICAKSRCFQGNYRPAEVV
jgi:hypothetical protein